MKCNYNDPYPLFNYNEWIKKNRWSSNPTPLYKSILKNRFDLYSERIYQHLKDTCQSELPFDVNDVRDTLVKLCKFSNEVSLQLAIKMMEPLFEEEMFLIPKTHKKHRIFWKTTSIVLNYVYEHSLTEDFIDVYTPINFDIYFTFSEYFSLRNISRHIFRNIKDI